MAIRAPDGANKVENGPKRPRRTKNAWQRQKIEFLDLKYLLFSGISLAEYGGSALLPLTENHPAQNPLAEMGVPPPTSLTEKNPLNSFWRPPFDVRKFRWHWGFSSTSWDRRPAILHSSDLKIRHVLSVALMINMEMMMMVIMMMVMITFNLPLQDRPSILQWWWRIWPYCSDD